ncbi:hypothetical protein UVI_02022930 [Ustilaginoidea virens]|uniref:Uncharacterized protein n=1 Tax=Ustilaginoidea virens TaxID=1159556 RepID=A0A1B5L3Z6_USTVR|nr:hypothetical protein UVI_02022930 [Ustilaginoidea virens]
MQVPVNHTDSYVPLTQDASAPAHEWVARMILTRNVTVTTFALQDTGDSWIRRVLLPTQE